MITILKWVLIIAVIQWVLVGLMVLWEESTDALEDLVQRVRVWLSHPES